MQTDIKNSRFTVNLGAIQQNYQTIKAGLPAGCAVLPMLKCNAYGHGAAQVAKALCQVEDIPCFAVAQVYEAAQLRTAGITKPEILITGGVPQNLLATAVELGLQLPVYSAEVAAAVAAAAKQAGKPCKVHIKIETGLGRLGAKPGAPLQALAQEICRHPQLVVAGAFTHFADAEVVNSPFTHTQLARFNQAVAQLQAAGIQPPLLHAANSSASEWLPEASFGAVRIGRRLYMDTPLLPGAPPPTGNIIEAGSWHANVVAVNQVAPGESVGYGGAFVAQRPMRVAVIGVGYGDGLVPGVVKAGGPVLVGAHRANLFGLCMDQCFADVTDIPCTVGDEVTFFGTAAGGATLPAQQVAAIIQNEGVFLTCMLSNRVERVYTP